MAMSEEDILREAARIQAGRRKRVAKTCLRCGRDFIGVAQARYCSDACRMAAAREREAQPRSDSGRPFQLPIGDRRQGESIREYFLRTTDGPLNEREEEAIEAYERIEAIWKNIGHSVEDSTELIRRQREERSDYLANL